MELKERISDKKVFAKIGLAIFGLYAYHKFCTRFTIWVYYKL